MRKLLTIIVYSLIMLLIGRNLNFLPRFTIFSNPKTVNEDRVETLKQKTTTIIKDAPGNYSLYFYDLKNNLSFGSNEQETFTGASINKVPIVAVLYYLNAKGKIDLDEQVTIQKKDIQDYGTGSIRYEKPGKAYSLKTLAKLAMKQSDNTAAHVLRNRIGADVMQRTLNEFGLTQTNMENNKISSYDLFLLFKKIYNSEITDEARSKELLGFMRDTDIEDRLPALLPSSAIAYHKTGDAVGSIHDAGIIETGNSAFFIGVLTSDIGDAESETKQTIAKIAQTIVREYTPD